MLDEHRESTESAWLNDWAGSTHVLLKLAIPDRQAHGFAHLLLILPLVLGIRSFHVHL